MKKLLFQHLVVLAFLAGTSGFAQAVPVFNNVTANSTTIPRLDKFELTFTLSGTAYTNAFDPAQINVYAVFVSPSSKTVTQYGFYQQDFTRTGPPEVLTPGAWSWKVRFSPNETGPWSYNLSAVDSSMGKGLYGPQTFTCAPSGLKGLVKVSAADSRYFQYDDGTQFIPIGQNVGWGGPAKSRNGGGTFDYDAWLTAMTLNGANFARFWMCPWYHSLEWQATGLGDYTKLMNDAWRLDYDLELARAKGIVVELCLLNHGSVSSDTNPNWPQSPYNSANGGPCATTRDFFTHPTAAAYWKRHLRYCAARWGYASNLVWEMCNEIDWTDKYRTDASVRKDVDIWVTDMCAALKSLDAGRHLVTTSYANSQYGNTAWNSPSVDFTQIHEYSPSAVLEDVLRGVVAAYRSAYGPKPVIVGEFGISDGAAAVTQDPGGITFHNALWGTLMGETAGAGACWWWDNYIDPKNLYSHYKGLSAFASQIDFARSGFLFRNPAATTSTFSDLVITGGISAWGVKAPAASFTVNADGTTTPDLGQMPAYLYGQNWNTRYRNAPVSFFVNYHEAGRFELAVASISASASLLISVDGVAAYNGPVKANTTYTAGVGAGPHAIAVDSVADDWIQVGSFTFSPYVTSLKTYALQGPSTIAAWILNRNVNYRNAAAKAAAPAVGGTVHFTGISRNGTWGVQWYDTLTGSLTGTASVMAVNGGLDVPVPPTAWDRALKMTFTGEVKPTVTAITTPSVAPHKLLKKPSVTQTPSGPKATPTQTPVKKKLAPASTPLLKKTASPKKPTAPKGVKPAGTVSSTASPTFPVGPKNLSSTPTPAP